ncbi:SpoIIE family protein phosphatase [Streptomyces sp. NPDC102462]|uniref:SpoIIE family protein phosphatase n=1 Tax=Streptomyces sp. NPDC102462 TaxID=3366178 RepID=UPI00382AC605
MVSGGLGAGPRDSLRGPYTATAVVDGTGRISLWSPQAESLLGYPADEICAKPAVDLLSPEDGQAAATAVRGQKAGQGWDGVLGLRHRDGHEVQVALHVQPVLCQDGQAGWSVSAADARQVEREQVDRAILQALFSQSPIPVTVMDSELRYRWVNAATEYVAATPAERLIGRRVGDDSPDVDFETIDQVLCRVRDTGEPVIDFLVRGRPPSDPDREHAWSASSYRLTDPTGHLLGMCQTYVDVTDGWRAQQRLTLLTEAGTRIGTTLDVAPTAQELADAAVPDLADIVVVDLLDATVRGEGPAPGPAGSQLLLRRSGIRTLQDGAPEAAYRVGETVTYVAGTPQSRCLAGGRSVLIRRLDIDEWYHFDARKAEKLRRFQVHSPMVVPLCARGITLGVASFVRYRNLQAYDEGDLALAEDFSSRAAVCIDNARRYTREHTTVLALQHSLLPRELPDYPAVETATQYLPAASHAGAGGDWFDVLPLSGARVALVVGDVTGHGLHAAAVMGRLRTAVHTLADLDLDPDEVLTQLDDLVIRLAEEDPDCQGATCLYAVYDPISRICVFARAGHPPPALVQPDGTVEFCDDIPPGPPLGLGGLPFETSQRRLSEGTLLALYTDGLVETPGHDIDIGLDRLARTLVNTDRPLKHLSEAIVTSLIPDHHGDDAALLLARTRALGADRVATWDLPADPALVSQARALTGRQLIDWGLEPLAFTTELIVSELVTNAIRHARGPIALRLIRAQILICEISDGSLSAPHLRRARTTEEGGRGVFLIAQLATRWGTRYTTDGKTIWAEQPLIPT